jgi:hypothetical protein
VVLLAGPAATARALTPRIGVTGRHADEPGRHEVHRLMYDAGGPQTNQRLTRRLAEARRPSCSSNGRFAPIVGGRGLNRAGRPARDGPSGGPVESRPLKSPS